jgi:cation:H+ antiporter
MLRGLRAVWTLAAARAAEAAGAAQASAAGAWSALWTFPAVLSSAFIIAWGAEVAQFFMSQGLALAILAWLQTLPEFAVEASIAWRQDIPNMTANFTGSLRLLVGLGWPMIFFVASFAHRRKTGRWLHEINLHEDHAIEVVGLLLPILYFFFVWWKATLGVGDAVVLTALYLAYLWVLNKMPPQDHEEAEDLDYVPRKVMGLRPGLRGAAITGLFVGGGLILYYTAHPFVDSLKAIALAAGIGEFVFIQWVAPFLSEFPEKVSAFKWAATVRKASMAVMNMVSSNINQWTMLAAMIPVVYSLSRGEVSAVPFDGMHRHEIMLTILQSLLGMVLLLNMKYSAWEAAAIFLLWLAQFLAPDIREEIQWAYVGLIALAFLQMIRGRRKVEAFRIFAKHWRQRVVVPRAAS